MKQRSQYLLRFLCLLLIAAIGVIYQIRAQVWQRAVEENRAQIAEVTAWNREIEQAVAAFPYRDGVYTASAPGFGGDITVTVTLENRKIAEISVDAHPGEDPLFFTAAQAVVDRILEAQSPDVDAVSGATFSSSGIREAVRAAMELAREDTE